MPAKSRHMLIIEDDLDGQEVMQTLLEHLDATTDVAGDAATAEALLFQSHRTYDAAIIDLALPDKDGWQILSEILANARTAELPCIAVTAYHTSKLREDALRAGFRAYFAKPVDGNVFITELDHLV